MSQGIKLIDNQGKTSFGTEKPRLQIAIDRTPPHIDRQTVTPTHIATNAGNNFLAQETLYEIKHGLGYKPRVLAYFLRAGTNRYDCGQTLFNFGAVDDVLTYDVDDTFFRIIHRIDDFLQIGFTSSANDVVTCKFMIFSNPVDNYTDPNLRK